MYTMYHLKMCGKIHENQAFHTTIHTCICVCVCVGVSYTILYMLLRKLHHSMEAQSINEDAK